MDISIDFIFCYYEQCSFYRSPGIHGQELPLDKPLGLELLDPEYMFSHFIRQCHIVFPKIVLILVGYTICKNFLPFYGLSFCLWVSLLCKKCLMRFHLAFKIFSNRRWTEKDTAASYVKECSFYIFL